MCVCKICEPNKKLQENDRKIAIKGVNPFVYLYFCNFSLIVDFKKFELLLFKILEVSLLKYFNFNHSVFIFLFKASLYDLLTFFNV